MLKLPKDATSALIESTELVMRLQQQRDELLSALEDLLSRRTEPYQAQANARAVLARVKGGPQ